MLIEFLVALQFLTVVRLKKTLPFSETTLGRAGAFFPLVGLLLGVAVWSLDRSLSPFLPASLSSVFLVAVLAVLSGGFHLDGLDLEFAEGDLRNAETVRPAMAGCGSLLQHGE